MSNFNNTYLYYNISLYIESLTVLRTLTMTVQVSQRIYGSSYLEPRLEGDPLLLCTNGMCTGFHGGCVYLRLEGILDCSQPFYISRQSLHNQSPMVYLRHLIMGQATNTLDCSCRWHWQLDFGCGQLDLWYLLLELRKDTHHWANPTFGRVDLLTFLVYH